MSLKQEIETWVEALGHYDNNEFENSLRVFDNIAETSKILFNCGVIHATLGEHERAVECYQRAIRLDQYLAVAYFQQGVSNFLLGDFEEALANFNDTLLYLRGNTYIDYEQLGLKFRLYSCEVLFNRGLCYIYLQQDATGLQDFEYAVKEKMTPDHDVIDDAIRERAEGYTVFSIPVGVVYRPNEAKVKNLKTKDYLGKARLVAAADRTNTSTGFQGSERKIALAAELAAKDDRPPENISFAATNLVQRGLSSRVAREQSAPPTMNRNLFPPTPPPESDKPVVRSSAPATTGRSASVRNPPTRALARQHQNGDVQANGRLDRPAILARMNTVDSRRSNSPLQGSNGSRPQIFSSSRSDRSRMGPTRTASESRAPIPQRQQSLADRGMPQRQPLFRETTPQRSFEPIQEDHGFEDVYDMYSVPNFQHGPRRRGSRVAANGEPILSQTSDEYMPNVYEEADYFDDEGAQFDMMSGGESRKPPHARTSSKRSEVKNIRVKVHARDDTRYIMIGPTVEYGDFEGKIREKFAIKSRLKIKMQDEGDMVTVSDQEDLEMLLATATGAANKENNEMAKLEVWIEEI